MISFERRNKNLFSALKRDMTDSSRKSPVYNDGVVHNSCVPFLKYDIELDGLDIRYCFRVVLTWKMAVCQKGSKVFIGQDLNSRSDVFEYSKSSTGDFATTFIDCVIDKDFYVRAGCVNNQVCDKVLQELSDVKNAPQNYYTLLGHMDYLYDSDTFQKYYRAFQSLLTNTRVSISLKPEQFKDCPDRFLLPYFIYDMNEDTFDYCYNIRAGSSRKMRNKLDKETLLAGGRSLCKEIMDNLRITDYCEIELIHRGMTRAQY